MVSFSNKEEEEASLCLTLIGKEGILSFVLLNRLE
jgi:hypothetical protein